MSQSERPYELHTNRELEFMLERGKPFAHFSDVYPADADEETIPEEAFAPYVKKGIFEKREFVVPEAPPPEHPHLRGTRHVLYARSNEAWRIDAWIMIITAAAKAGWNEGFERLEGALLGYEEWQTDFHLEAMRNNPEARKLFFWLRKPSKPTEI